MSRPLFRPEVTQTPRNGWLGTISLAQPPAIAWLAMLAVLAALAVAGVLIFGSYTQHVRVSGRLVMAQGAQLQAELELPESALAFVDTGARVQLRYPAFPYRTFGHHAGRIAGLIDPAGTRPDANGNLRYRVRVLIDNPIGFASDRRIRLRPGLRVDADLPLERRRLHAWLFNTRASTPR